MSDNFDAMVAPLQQKIAEHEKAISLIKQTINQIAQIEKRPQVYSDADLQASTSGATPFRPDQFTGKPLASSVTMVLEQRHATNLGAVSAEDLYAALIAGGYDFDTKSESQARRKLAIALSKNMLFQRTPNGFWGLRKWYGKANAKKKSAAESSEEAEAQEDYDAEVEDLIGESPEKEGAEPT